MCDKKTISKELIEGRVLDACMQLLTDEKIKFIVDEIVAASERDADLLSVKRLKASIKEAEKAIENLWKALESGQSVEMITERINKREEEKQALQTQLAVEMKKQVGFEYPQILAFLEYLRDLPDDNEMKRNGMINIFVNAIYLYDDHFTLILNAGTRQLEIENIPLDDIEVAFGDSAPADETGSLIVSNVPPINPT